MRRDPCAVCGLPVFLAEKLMIARTPYHRTCFRCARCNNQLTPGNYYETEEGQYCCETCPDEETSTLPPSMHQKYNEAVIFGGSSEKSGEEGAITSSSYQRSLSDEEKTGRRTLDTYTPGNKLQDSSVPDLIAQTSQLRLNFMATHLLSERNDGDQDGSLVDEELSRSAKDLCVGPERESKRVDGAFSDSDENDEHGEEEYEEEEDDEEEDDESSSSTGSSIESQSRRKIEDDGGDLAKDDVHSTLDDNVDTKRNKGQRLTAISFHDVIKDKSVSLICKEDDTKEPLGQAGHCEDSDRGLSLVQKRLRMFEAQDKKDQVERKDKVRAKSVDVPEGRVQAKERSMIAVKDHEDVQTNVESSAVSERDGKVDVLKSNKATIGNEDSSKVRPASPDKEDSPRVSQIISSAENTSKTSIKNLKEEDEKDTNGGIVSAESSPSIQTSTATLSVDRNNESNVEQTSVNSVKDTSLTTMEGIDLSDNDDYPEDLNPFKDDIEDEGTTDKCPATMDSSKSSRISKNPFESEEEEDEEKDIVPPKPAARNNVSSNRAKQPLIIEVPIKRRLAAPQINLNPFWSDDDDHDSDLECKEQTPGNVPVPKPRTIKHTPELGIPQRKSGLNRSGLYASNSSITSSESATTPSGTYRKKKPAPPPPTVKELFSSDQHTPLKAHNNSPGFNGTSPRTTPRARKTKPAPPPPLPTSTPYNISIGAPLNLEDSPIPESHEISESHNIWEDQKTNKDEANRNRQSLSSISCGDNVEYKAYPDKSVQGKWKRKKGPAPPRPMPHRRKIKVMSLKDVKLELDEIELQQQGLERQGVRLEQLIRDKCESGSRINDTCLSIDVEELVLELFALVNEKNELFRRQAELMLLRRQQRLEEEHAEVEYQIRCLMSQPEATKTDFEKQREEALIQRLIEIVERRNEIVECLEMDRRREVEEDRSIHKHMGLFAARNKNEISSNDNDDTHSSKTKKMKTKEKGKEKKSKKTPKKDADKDVDETELKLKRHSKRKWF